MFLFGNGKHWAVLCSSLGLAFCIFGVAPLTGVIFSKQFNIERTETMMFLPVNPLGNVSEAEASKAAFAYKAYSHLYSNGTLPAFTSARFAVMPFAPAKSLVRRQGELWVAKTTLIEAELDCNPGKVSGEGYKNIMNAENDCSLVWKGSSDGSGLKNEKYSTFMIDKDYLDSMLWKDSINNYATFNSCRRNGTFVGYWGKREESVAPKPTSRPVYNQATAIFCRPVHRKQEVTVTVDPAGRIIGLPTTLTPKSEYDDFNLTSWKILALGYGSLQQLGSNNIVSYTVDGLDPLDQGLPDHTSQLIKKSQFQEPATDKANITQNINVDLAFRRSFTPFGLARQENLDELLDPQKLSRMFSDGYQYLFAMAAGASRLIVGDRTKLPQFEGKIKYTTTGYVLDNTWTRVLQACLAMVIILNILLVSILWNRPCGIDSDPGTLASAMACVDQAVLNDFQDAEFLSTKELSKKLSDSKHKYHLQGRKVEVVGQINTGEETQSDSEESSAGNTEAPISPKRDQQKIVISKPWDLAAYIGIISSVIILGAIILLSTLYGISNRNRGFKKPQKKMSYDIYSSYVPMIVSMIFEAYLVLLTSHVTYMWPFQRLLRGNSTAAPLTFNYDKTPPHLQVICGIKTRNYLLAALSTSVLLANILAVAMGGLFQVERAGYADQGEVYLNGTIESLKDLNSNSTFLKDKTYVDSEFMYNAVGDGLGFDARPWMTDDLYYVPFHDESADQLSTTNYSASTTGVGLNISCEEAPSELWNSLAVRWEKTMPIQTITYPTLAENKNISLLITGTDRTRIELLHDSRPEPLIQHAYLFRTLSYAKDFNINITWSDPNAVAFFELGPKPYRPQIESEWEFYHSWVRYSFGKRKVTINRPLINGKLMDEVRLTLQSDQSFNGKTVYGDNAFPKVNAIRCQLAPRVVQSYVTVTAANRTGQILETERVEERSVRNAQAKDTGIVGLLNAFKEMVYRDSATSLVTPRHFDRTGARNTSSPRTWTSFLVEKECNLRYPNFSLYENPEQNSRCMESVYKKLFATYLQLHSDEIFRPVQSSQKMAIPAQFVHEESRVLVRPVAFYVSVGLLALFLPVVCWTYISLFNAFLTHEPTSLAGTYAAFYASNALQDVQGTHLMQEKERKDMLFKKGSLYQYGWFVGGDGKNHFGISRETGSEGISQPSEQR
ncbi:Similar to hypothetical protein LEMA_P014390.1 [Leptosphaeria maculans JN3]; acc. no. CBY00309 [Pyronema omphalodes CBS 100304]|uniref:Uncharacterized protein n=1 Tax=Pyronema omphalodes (strain CBS 100304) TaxID=1076935 RepID=U4L7Y7_PYROM|nr:Similar to hypothetical protein LEMA_P014390.1 [Leptosphaeria maculans JN3]; acc. no. CBY00309 [Pyronema omphalodes CBS 100304]